MRRLFSNGKSKLAWIAIVAVFCWALVTIAMRRTEEAPRRCSDHPPCALAIGDRRSRWVGGGSCRIRKVASKRSDCSGGHSGSYLRTVDEYQLMGGTAPDIVQAGMVEGHLMTAFFTRYFIPLSRYVTRPNPYNAGTDLEKVPLIRTFRDGMRRSFIDETQEFMTIPLALTGVRLFYNKPLLKRLTGLDEAPTDYRAFLEACEKIRTQRQTNGQPYVAIAGSRFHLRAGTKV